MRRLLPGLGRRAPQGDPHEPGPAAPPGSTSPPRGTASGDGRGRLGSFPDGMPSDPGAAFRSLDLLVRRHLDGLLQGDHVGVRLGSGSDPEEVVRYRPGEDDVRRIDWNVTARTGDPHVWRSRAEHKLDTWVLVDETASMDFGTARCEKRDLATFAAAVVALLTDGPGNRVGLCRLTPGGVAWQPALPGRVAARRVTHAAAAYEQNGRAEPGPPGPTLAQGLVGLQRRVPRPGLRVVISDFVEPDGSSERPLPWERELRRLASRHDVIVVEVLDPRELELPDLGLLLLTDPESGARQEVWTSKKLRRRYAQAAAEHRAAVAAGVQACGADHVVLRTDTDWVRELARFVVTRRRAATHPRRMPR